MTSSDLAIAPVEHAEEHEAPERVTVEPKGVAGQGDSSKSSMNTGGDHGSPHVIGTEDGQEQQQPVTGGLPPKKKAFAYLKTRTFWIVLALSQTLALCQTGTNTFTTLLNNHGASIPAFQSFFNYVLLNLVYTSYTIYRYGFMGWLRVIKKDGWRYLILAFFDVEGNYFVVKGYQYTNIVSAELFSFWTIVVVVVLSFAFLRVRYHIAQYAGIVVCCAGFGVMIGSDRITGGSSSGPNPVKGDLFVLLSASLYGISNVMEEFLVSKKPMYEVIGQLAFYGMVINGAQAGIFDREAFRTAHWDGQVGGYLVGYTLLLFIFYSLAPIVFRMSSAAFFNIGLLTGNFWSLAVGVGVFGYSIHWMYPLAFVLILLGHFVYYGTEGVLGDAQKPWLGENQEAGSDGIGSAKRRLQNPDAIV